MNPTRNAMGRITDGPAGRKREWLVVGAAFAALVAVAAVWLALDRRPPEWDHANHLERAVACAQDLARGDLRAILERSAFYPPLVTCTAAVAYRLAPSDVAAAQAVVLAFLGLGMGAVYVLGRRVAGGVGGVVAAVLFGSAPFVVFSSLRFQLDLPLASMVALALVVLLRAEGFSHPGWSLAAGVVLGLGMLTKPPFAVYVLPALVLAAARIGARRGIVNAGLAALIATTLALPWYGPRLFGIAPDIAARSFRQAAESGHPDPLTAAALALYPTWFLPQFGVVAVLLFAIGLVVGAARRQWLLLASALAPLALFMLIQNKNLRYTLPLLPVAAVLAGVGFSALPPRGRTLAGAALVAVTALQVSATAFTIPRAPALPGLGVPLVFESPPRRENWRHREILARIMAESGGAPATVSVVPNDNFFSVSNFRYYAVRDGLSLRWARAWDGEPVGIAYMILKTGHQGPPWTAEKPRRIAERLAADPHLARVFPVIGEWTLPDGSVASLRARRMPAVASVPPKSLAREIEQAIRRRLAEVARDVEGLEVRVTHDDGILRGRLGRVELEARAATFGELWRRTPALLRVRDLRIVVADALVNPLSAQAEGRLDPLDAGRLRLERATILARDFAAFLQELKGFKHASVELGNGAAAFAFRQPGPDVTARVLILPARDRPFALEVEDVRLAGVAVPRGLVNWVVRNYDPTFRIASRLPFPVEVAAITVSRDAIRIADPR